jgi:hypothetical protein
MALWQASFAVIPGGPYPADYRAQLDAIAPPYMSWSSEIVAWGEENGHRLELYLEGGVPSDGLLRIDLRQANLGFLPAVLDWLREWRFGLEDGEGRWIEPVLGDVAVALRGSRAFRFVENPERYFNRLSAGRLDDA